MESQVGVPTVIAAVSSSVFVNVRSAGLMRSYFTSALVAGPIETVKGWGPSATRSSTPVTVTVCGAFQSAAVKVRLAGETTPSAVLLDASGIVTSAVGCDPSTTVNVTDVPASDVEVPLGVPTVIPATSLSVFVNGRSVRGSAR